jgi:phosphatidylinositol 3-kinase
VERTGSFVLKVGQGLQLGQLLMSMVRVFQRLLCTCLGLDLCLLPREVLALSVSEGVMEYIHHCFTLKDVLLKFGTVRLFLAEGSNTGEPSLPVIERYLKNCAGYCVLVYVLGVWDGYSEITMLRNDGTVSFITLTVAWLWTKSKHLLSIALVTNAFNVN